jgi:hypothetical protein
MKTKFNNKETCHLFFNDANLRALNQVIGSTNLYFKGNTLYSYGYHYELAIIVNPDTVFMNSSRYSATTVKHQAYTRNAYNRYVFPNAFYFDFPKTDHANMHEAARKYYMAEIQNNLENASRAKSRKDFYLSYAIGEANTLQRFLTLFPDYSTPEALASIESVKSVDLEALKKSLDQVARQKALETKIRNEEIRKENEEKIQNWINGVSNHFPWQVSDVYLRAIDGTLQTSKGARVDLKEAKILFMMMQAGKPVHGEMLGSYRVVRYVNDTLVIGCHTITKTEIDRFAASQNWI